MTISFRTRSLRDAGALAKQYDGKIMLVRIAHFYDLPPTQVGNLALIIA
jgi:hypothetical protein